MASLPHRPAARRPAVVALAAASAAASNDASGPNLPTATPTHGEPNACATRDSLACDVVLTPSSLSLSLPLAAASAWSWSPIRNSSSWTSRVSVATHARTHAHSRICEGTRASAAARRLLSHARRFPLFSPNLVTVTRRARHSLGSRLFDGVHDCVALEASGSFAGSHDRSHDPLTLVQDLRTLRSTHPTHTMHRLRQHCRERCPQRQRIRFDSHSRQRQWWSSCSYRLSRFGFEGARVLRGVGPWTREGRAVAQPCRSTHDRLRLPHGTPPSHDSSGSEGGTTTTR